MLVQTSLANRTSPVLRGKWVMEVLMGTPPPPPPPDIPALEETAESKNGKMLTTRERMEMHRANPTCNACHRFMDPIGLALDNFDVTAKWRTRENGMPLDTKGDYYDGTPVTTPAELLRALIEAPGAAGADLHREPAGLRAGPAGRDLRSAGDPSDCEGGRGERLPDVVVHPRRDQERRVSDEAGGSRCPRTTRRRLPAVGRRRQGRRVGGVR